MDITQVILIVIGLYIIYTYMYKKETFAMSPATLTQLKSTSTENSKQKFVCKNCGGSDILLIGDVEYNKRRNYG